MAAEMFKSAAKVNIVHVPYQGSAPAFVDVLSGRVDIIFGVITTAMQQSRAGKVRALAVTGAKRSAVLPEMPTIRETALPGYNASGWYAIFGPAGMPKDTVTKLNEAILKIMNAPDTRKRLMLAGLEPETSTPDQLREILRDATTRYTRVIREAGIKGEYLPGRDLAAPGKPVLSNSCPELSNLVTSPNGVRD